MYGDFTVKHFHEKLVERHGYRLGYTVTRLALQASGLVRKAPRRGAHRRKRPRRPMPGMLLHQDGSTHAWLAGQPPLDLIVTLDDATSEIHSAFLVAEGGHRLDFRGLAEAIARKGLFCSLYTDRGGHYFHTPVAGGRVSREQPTQVGRALAELGVEHVPAYAPEARGRSERAFRTLQDRLVKELALTGIATVAAANRFIAEPYLPAHNVRFAVAAAEPGSAFVACPPEAWRDSSAGTRPGRSATTTPSLGAADACESRLALRPHSAPPSVIIPARIDQNPCAHARRPMERMRHGWSMRSFHAAQQWATMSS